MISTTSRICMALALAGAFAAGAQAEEAGWRRLFDGKTLDGWEVRSGYCTYRVEDGAIVGKTAEGSGNTFLCTKEHFGDIELKFEVFLDDKELNSGVQVRSQIRDGDHGGRVHGPQTEIAAGGRSGFVYGEGLGGWLSPEMKSGPEQAKPHEHFKLGEWNQYRVRAEGDHLQVWLNGELVTDFKLEGEHKETYRTGLIGLQVHGIKKETGPYQVRWRNIQVRPLAAEAKGE